MKIHNKISKTWMIKICAIYYILKCKFRIKNNNNNRENVCNLSLTLNQRVNVSFWIQVNTITQQSVKQCKN